MIERRQVHTPLGEMTETTLTCDGCGQTQYLGFLEWNWNWARIYIGEPPDWLERALCPDCKRTALWCEDCQAFHLPGEPHK
jgi:hypothetical protein